MLHWAESRGIETRRQRQPFRSDAACSDLHERLVLSPEGTGLVLLRTQLLGGLAHLCAESLLLSLEQPHLVESSRAESSRVESSRVEGYNSRSYDCAASACQRQCWASTCSCRLERSCSWAWIIEASSVLTNSSAASSTGDRSASACNATASRHTTWSTCHRAQRQIFALAAHGM